MMALLITAFVVTQEICDDQVQVINTELAEHQNDDDQQEEGSSVYLTSHQTLHPTTNVQIEPFLAIFIRELFVEPEIKQPIASDISLEESQHFKTLFRQIQSPNAP